MSRAARKKSKSGIYHVIVRGINRQNIFQDEEDRDVFVDRLFHYCKECRVILHAYCLMANHVHLLIGETEIPLAVFMKKLGTSYSYRFNWKYNRSGHLFQDRYKSESVEDDSYFITVFRYIHHNPEKASLKRFVWTSYPCYKNGTSGCETEYAISVFGSSAALLDYLDETTDDPCMDIDERCRWTDEEVSKLVCRRGKVTHCQQLQLTDSALRNQVLHELRAQGVSIRQLERLTGINRGTIARA